MRQNDWNRLCGFDTSIENESICIAYILFGKGGQQEAGACVHGLSNRLLSWVGSWRLLQLNVLRRICSHFGRSWSSEFFAAAAGQMNELLSCLSLLFRVFYLNYSRPSFVYAPTCCTATPCRSTRGSWQPNFEAYFLAFPEWKLLGWKMGWLEKICFCSCTFSLERVSVEMSEKNI